MDLIRKISLNKHLLRLTRIRGRNLHRASKTEGDDSISEEDAPPEPLEPDSGLAVQRHLVEAVGVDCLGVLDGDVEPDAAGLFVVWAEAVGEK